MEAMLYFSYEKKIKGTGRITHGVWPDRLAILEARALKKRQGAVGLPKNDSEHLPKSRLIGWG